MYTAIIILLCVLPFTMSREPWFIETDQEELDISEINKDLDLFEGDIMNDIQSKTRITRNAVLPSTKLWDIPISYVLEESLDINSKGIILQAFEHFRLKSCVDFRPRQSEEDFLSIRKNPGCYSFLAKLITNGQVVSIGSGCGYLAVVEHEILHALGLHHEQSRYDRDDYVNIIWKNIKTVAKLNFGILSRESSTTFGTQYDYSSVMHYGSKVFSKNRENTIVPKLLEYQDIIGQRMEMSPTDVYKLNRLYNCSTSVSFLDFCDFSSTDICGMSSCNKGSAEGWKRVTSAPGGPDTDSTSLIGTKGYFMHASTASRKMSDSAWLETKKMSPTRECHIQCLQFYYYHSGSNTSQLNIWIREFRHSNDSTGDLRLMDQITGKPTFEWTFHKVALSAAQPFQVVFEVRGGDPESLGGFSIDDVNLSQSECPHHVWQIKNFERVLTTSDYDTYWFSPRVYSPEGYAYQIYVTLRESFFGIGYRLVSGTNDSQLQWPCVWKQVTIIMLDQNPHVQRQMSKQSSLIADPSNESAVEEPSVMGHKIRRNGESFYVNRGLGMKKFLTLEEIQKRNFLKRDTAVFLFSMTDVSSLRHQNSLPCPKRPPSKFTTTYQNTSMAALCGTGFDHEG